jgi:hypothetical protein
LDLLDVRQSFRSELNSGLKFSLESASANEPIQTFRAFPELFWLEETSASLTAICLFG